MDLPAHAGGVRPPQRPRRPHPGAGRRQGRLLEPAVLATRWDDSGIEPTLSFPTDLYRGTAPYYDCYRQPYPEALLEDLCRRATVSGTGRLLDLACGTGQIAFPLAGRFAEVVAVDQEPESIAFAQGKAEAAGVTNIRWLARAAQEVELGGPFELITVGNAFHRLDRPAVARRMFSWLEPGAGVALVWGGTPGRGEQPWQLDRHPHDKVLAEAGFDYVGRFEFAVELSWTAESLVGFSYSTSFLNREVLGGRTGEFERELADRVHGFEPGGVLHESASFAYQLARKPEPA